MFSKEIEIEKLEEKHMSKLGLGILLILIILSALLITSIILLFVTYFIKNLFGVCIIGIGGI